MASASPPNDRAYAYFRVVGDFDPGAITSAIGLAPSEAWARGETFQRSGRSLIRRADCWRLDSGLAETAPMDDHVAALLRVLAPRRDGLLALPADLRRQIVCIGHFRQSFSWELDFSHQKLATDLGICFWIEAYALSETAEAAPRVH
ncbi:DUF4279 domain-containing protein [Azorhizobium oxalatiphilum]|nr:DUF4279 domain-containing protein [Azorhizobium oxalatiphilum]